MFSILITNSKSTSKYLVFFFSFTKANGCPFDVQYRDIHVISYQDSYIILFSLKISFKSPHLHCRESLKIHLNCLKQHIQLALIRSAHPFQDIEKAYCSYEWGIQSSIDKNKQQGQKAVAQRKQAAKVGSKAVMQRVDKKAERKFKAPSILDDFINPLQTIVIFEVIGKVNRIKRVNVP